MYIIAGLGNPGKKYENTRHNMGFLAVDLLAEKYGIRIDKIKFKALVGEGRIAGQKVLLVKPQTYMNLSGQSIVEVMNFYKVEIENLIVIYDDIDIPTGTIRLRKKGSAGTHNGMRNIVYLLGDDGFPRIRVVICVHGLCDIRLRFLYRAERWRYIGDNILCAHAGVSGIRRAAAAAGMGHRWSLDIDRRG